MRRRACRVREARRKLQKAAVAPAQLAEDAHRRVRVLVAVRQRLEVRPQRGHNVLDVRLHDRIEELLREVVDAQLECAQTLRHQRGRRLQRKHERVHQLPKVRQQHTQAHRHSQAQVHKDLALRRLRSVEQQVELLEQHGQQRQHVLVQQLEAPPADAAEQRTQQQKVVRRLVRAARALERVHDEVRQVRLQHRLVLLREDGHRHERHLEQAQAHARELLVRRAEIPEPLHEKLEQDLDEPARHGVVREQVLRDAEQHRRAQDLLKQKRHVRRKHLVERLRLQVDKDVRKQVHHVLLLAPVPLRLQQAAAHAAHKHAAHHAAVRLGHTTVLEHRDQRLEAKQQVAEQEARVLERIRDLL